MVPERFLLRWQRKQHKQYVVPLFLLLVVGLLLPLAPPPGAGAAPPPDDAPNQGVPEVITLSPESADESDTHAQGDIALSAESNGYRSPAVQTDRPFTHMLLRTELTDTPDTPDTPLLLIDVRASSDGTDWTDWTPAPANNDLWKPWHGDHVVWSPILYAGESMRFWQVRVLPADNADLPAIQRIEVHTVDTSYGSDNPTPPPRLSNTDKPPVVSRTAWGCPDGQVSRNPPAYRFATHMVVHHTAGRNTLGSSEESWADRVRAIWSYHAVTLGWGDIGYNYIIDPNGVVYEGRAGGENAVAFHDTGNYGSMGVSVIGNYTSVIPSAVSIDSLEAILAWKASQNDIDPMGSSYYHGCYISTYCRPYAPDAIIPTIAGHRQVTPGHTTCPGDQFMAQMPLIRTHVKERLAGVTTTEPTDNGDLVVDELESPFSRSDANWYAAACGYGGHTYYTYTTDTPIESTNYATWTVTISTTGHYRVYAHIPQGCGLATAPYASTQAVYRIHSADGVAQRTVDHNTADEWVDLGTYLFVAGSDSFVTLDDLTGEPYADQRILFFDSIKWLPEDEATTGTGEGVELLDVAYDRTTITAGDVLRVSFTVRNNTDSAVQTQEPQAGILADGSYDPTDGYVYDQGECFAGNEAESYPVYQKEHDRYRLMLGANENDNDIAVGCARETGGYPWRWGLNGALQPGETRTVTGFVRFRVPGTVTLKAGMIHEYVNYIETGLATQEITVLPEQQLPLPASYTRDLLPLAHISLLNPMPDNLLVRTHNSLSVQRGEHIGAVAWDGSTLDWRDGSHRPAGVDLDGPFLLEQTRVFSAPVQGDYTFRTTTSGGSWLWVDGQQVVVNNNLLDTTEQNYEMTRAAALGSGGQAQDVPDTSPDTTLDVTGTVTLSPGLHTLAFKYFALEDESATAGYAVQLPDTTTYVTLTEALSSSAPVSETTFATTPTLALAADDLGGEGVASISYAWDSTDWVTDTLSHAPTMPVLQLQPPLSGTNSLRYRVTDGAGNVSDVYSLSVSVGTVTRPDDPDDPDDPGPQVVSTVYVPLVRDD